MEKDFLPQFEKSSEELLTVMQLMPIPKGGKQHG